MKRALCFAAIAILAMSGCNKQPQDESLAKRAGNTVGETITDFASGVGKGVDKQMTVNVELAEALAEAGISKSVAKSTGMMPEKSKGISVYLIASKPFKSKLLAKALDKDGQEIGRSVVDVEFAEDDAKYVSFGFESEMDTQLVDKYVITVKK